MISCPHCGSTAFRPHYDPRTGLYDQSCVACGHVPGPEPLPLKRKDQLDGPKKVLSDSSLERSREEWMAENATRDQIIRALRTKGMSVKDVAAQFKLSTRSIHRVCQ